MDFSTLICHVSSTATRCVCLKVDAVLQDVDLKATLAVPHITLYSPQFCVFFVSTTLPKQPLKDSKGNSSPLVLTIHTCSCFPSSCVFWLVSSCDQAELNAAESPYIDTSSPFDHKNSFEICFGLLLWFCFDLAETPHHPYCVWSPPTGPECILWLSPQFGFDATLTFMRNLTCKLKPFIFSGSYTLALHETLPRVSSRTLSKGSVL